LAAKVKYLTHAADEAAYWATKATDVDASVVNAGASLLGTSRVTLAWTRNAPAGIREDRAVTSIWVAKAAGGGLFSMVPVSELAAMETALDTFALGLTSPLSSDWTLVEYAWHQVNQDSPRDETGRGQKMGPAVRVTVKSNPGAAGTTRLPDQVASTITLRTVVRSSWGRMYVPGGIAANLQTNYGRWTTTRVDTLAGLLNTLHDAWQTLGYQIGVYSMLHPAFLTPKQIEVDDIPDIVRRRRPKQANYRKIFS
jgi:hypothetical protein